MLEEVYVYFDMPPPAFGIQLVYDNPDSARVRQPSCATATRC